MIRIEVRKRKAPEIGIAPLVDCVLLLLVFFLLTSSFSVQRAMHIELPQSSTADRADNDRIKIMVSDTGTITLGERPMTPSELTTALRDAVSDHGKKPVMMVADRLVPLERITAVIDCIREAELDTVAIATSRTPEEEDRDE